MEMYCATLTLSPSIHTGSIRVLQIEDERMTAQGNRLLNGMRNRLVAAFLMLCLLSAATTTASYGHGLPSATKEVPAADFVGSYSDPNHPNCLREIQIQQYPQATTKLQDWHYTESPSRYDANQEPG